MENTQKTYTLREVVLITADILKGIQVPVELSEQIGLPVLSAIRNLGVIAHQMEEAEVAASERKQYIDKIAAAFILEDYMKNRK